MDSDKKTPRFSVSDFLAVLNQTLDYAFGTIEIEGEVANFKVNKGKWVFFDLKDKESTVPVFMTIFQIRTTIRDGMKVVVSGSPRVTGAGRFSFTGASVRPIGEGSIKKSFELLKTKLEKQGLFDVAKKRPIPKDFQKLGVISSVSAAGYADFIKILNARWGGLDVWVANCGVQGASAADEIMRAIDFFNEQGEVEIIAIVRGGGSADDLAVFNDEPLVRKIAASKIPIITGIGHEVDESLADLAADVRASTPTNAAEMLTKDKEAELWRMNDSLVALGKYLDNYLSTVVSSNKNKLGNAKREIILRIERAEGELAKDKKILESLNPEKVLKQGYAIVSGKISPGSVVKITTFDNLISAEVKDVRKRTN